MDDNICGFCIHATNLESVDDSIDDIFCDIKGRVFAASATACEKYVDESVYDEERHAFEARMRGDNEDC